MVIPMGSPKDILVVTAERDIRHMFSVYEGWKVAPVRGPPSAGSFYQASRGRWGGEETAFIAVSFDPVPKEESINALDLLPNSQGSKTKKYLLTPQATNTSGIPPHIKILPMSTYAFDRGELVWLTNKKNAKKFVPQPSVAAPTAG